MPEEGHKMSKDTIEINPKRIKERIKQFIKRTQFELFILIPFLLYGFIIILHYGIFFYDLDKLLTSLVITLLGILISHLYTLKKDVSAIDQIVTKLDNVGNK